jgi:regulator of sigma E protease
LLIFVHELGHFFAARWRGMKVDRFAIWFGKPIWKKKIGGVEYALGWIPAGGYVALPQMATMEAIEGKSDTPVEKLPVATPLDKIIVAFAGPLFSFLLAIAFACVVTVVGKPDRAGNNNTVIGWVTPAGPAWNAGLRPGDTILEVDGHVVKEFAPPSQDSVTWRIITSENPSIAIKYLRDGQPQMVHITPTNLPTKWYERRALRKILIAPSEPAIIASVLTNSPAARAGLQTNDEIVAINNEKILSPQAVFEAQDGFTNANAQPVAFTVRRDGKELTVNLSAESPARPTNAPPVFGLACWFGSTEEKLSYPRPLEQIKTSAGQIFATIKAVTSRKSDVGVQQLGGAVMIIRAYKTFIDAENGWRRVLWFSVILNVNLALLNMLPLPVLDGGHILLSLIEAIRRRPVSTRVVEILHTGCTVVLILFMIVIAFYDAGDWWRNSKEDRVEPVVFLPKN